MDKEYRRLYLWWSGLRLDSYLRYWTLNGVPMYDDHSAMHDHIKHFQVNVDKMANHGN